jgi:hypothetical protein
VSPLFGEGSGSSTLTTDSISQIAYHTTTPLLVEDEFLIVTWAIVICTIVGPVGVGWAVKRWGRRILDGGWE